MPRSHRPRSNSASSKLPRSAHAAFELRGSDSPPSDSPPSDCGLQTSRPRTCRLQRRGFRLRAVRPRGNRSHGFVLPLRLHRLWIRSLRLRGRRFHGFRVRGLRDCGHGRRERRPRLHVFDTGAGQIFFGEVRATVEPRQCLRVCRLGHCQRVENKAAARCGAAASTLDPPAAAKSPSPSRDRSFGLAAPPRAPLCCVAGLPPPP